MTTAAEVLYGHFKAISALDPAKTTWQQAWASTLAGRSWVESVGDLLNLHHEVEASVRNRRDVDPDELLLHSPHWRQVILLQGINIGAHMAGTLTLDRAAVSALYQLSTLARWWPGAEAQTVRAESVAELARSIADLREEVLAAADLAEDLAAFLLDLIAQMQQAVDKRVVLGDRPLQDLAGQTLAHCASHASLWDQIMASPVGVKVGAALAAVAAVSGLMGDVEQIVSTTQKVVQELRLPEAPKAIEGPTGGPLAITVGTDTATE